MVTKKIIGRGRPRGFDIDNALSIAKKLFHQRGFDGVGVAELSQLIGITPPSLYSAFGSKRQLFEQVLQKYVNEDSGWLIASLAEEDTIEAALSHLFNCASEVYTADSSRLGCLVLDGTRNCTDTKACELSAGFRQATWQMICDRIAKEYPELAPTLANYVLTTMMGLSAAARDGMSQADLKVIGQIAVSGFLAYLKQASERLAGKEDKVS